MKRYTAGDPIEFDDLEVGMKVTTQRGGPEGLTVTARVTRIISGGAVTRFLALDGLALDGQPSDYYLGSKGDVWAMAEDWNPLPEVEGLYVADYEVLAGGDLESRMRRNRLGRWVRRQNGAYSFRPVDVDPWHGIPGSRIHRLVPVAVVPDSALDALAELQREFDTAVDAGWLPKTRQVLDDFFRLTNEVQG